MRHLVKALQIVEMFNLDKLSNEEALKVLATAKEMIEARPKELFCEKINKE